MMVTNSLSGTGGLQPKLPGMNVKMDSTSKNIQNQIANAQKKLQELSSNTEMAQKALEEKIGESFTIIHREGDFMEVVPKGFNKATGIQKICEILGVSHEDTYSFGDSTNDLDMLS